MWAGGDFVRPPKAVFLARVGVEGKRAPVVNDEGHGRGRIGDGVANGVLERFDERGKGDVLVVEEAAHRFDGGHGHGGAGQSREPGDGRVRAVRVFLHQLPVPLLVKFVQTMKI